MTNIYTAQYLDSLAEEYGSIVLILAPAMVAYNEQEPDEGDDRRNDE